MKDLIERLERNNLKLSVNGNDLDVFFDGDQLPADLLEELKVNKGKLIEYLIQESENNHANNGHSISYAQQGLWIQCQFAGASGAYNIHHVLRFFGTLDVEALEKSFLILIQRHEVLRTNFKLDGDGVIKQYIRPIEQVSWSIDRKSLITGESINDCLRQYLTKEFNLEHGTLVRCLLMTDKESTYLTFVIHHIICDGWSLKILVRDLLEIYNGLINQRALQLPELNIQYKDFVNWQNDKISTSTLLDQKKYWLNALKEELPVLDLPGYKARPISKTYTGNHYRTSFAPELSHLLKSFCNASQGTLFMGLMAAVRGLLYRYSHQEDLIIGTPTAGRNHIDLSNQIGLFINTLPLRIKILADDSFEKLMESVKKCVVDAYDNQEYPIELITQSLAVTKDHGRHPLFDIMVILQNDESIDFSIKGLQSEHIYVDPLTSKLDVTFEFLEDGKGNISLNVEYNTDVYDELFITQLTNHLKQFVQEAILNPSQRISDIDFLTPIDKRQLLEDFNSTHRAYAKDKTLVDLFEEQVKKRPEGIALYCENFSFSYQELNDISNRVAHYLRDVFCIESNDLIGINLERDEWLFISMLGILKSGGAYVPLDLDYPDYKVNYIIESSRCKTIIDLEWLTKFQLDKANYSTCDLSIPRNANHLISVIYTSGSTGHPKGVMIKQENLLNRLFWMWENYPFVNEEICVSRTPISFVDHMWEIFGPLLKGIPLVVVKKSDVLDIPRFIQLLSKHSVSRIVLIPALLKNILDYPELCHNYLQKLHYWTCSGDILSADLVEKFSKFFPYKKLFNIYGSTEVTADATFFDVRPWIPNLQSAIPIPQIYDDSLSLEIKKTVNNKIPSSKIVDDYSVISDRKLFQSVELSQTGNLLEYSQYLEHQLLNGVIQLDAPKFIGHMTGPIPPMVKSLNELMVSLNQNMVKIETSGVSSLIERQCIGILHKLVYKRTDDYYRELVQSTEHSLGIVTGGGTISNISALSYALSSKLAGDSLINDLNKEGLLKALNKHGYIGVIVLGSKRSHYSIKKALKIMGLGYDAFVEITLENDTDAAELDNLIQNKQKEGLLVLAIIGVAGSTETGSVDQLSSLGNIARKNKIHYHIDAAFGGAYIFSTDLSYKLTGVELCDSISICAHKQLSLPMGSSVCLFGDATFAKKSENNTAYQARKGSADLGKFTIEGSRAFVLMMLHGVLKVLGKSGIGELVDSNYKRADLFRDMILKHSSFELYANSDLNIVLYRYLPPSLKGKRISPEENNLLNAFNEAIQKTQFQCGNSFVSYTTLKNESREGYDQLWFRTVLMNPYTTEQHLLEILHEQEEIAISLFHQYWGYSITNFETEVSIGKPISNTEIYILSDTHQLVPPNVVGEICVGGLGITDGYINDPGLTQKSYIDHPFKPNEKIYKTGDLGKWLADGTIKFIQRKNQVIKINGVRIELGEVEYHLNQIPYFKEAAVRVINASSGAQEIEAFYVSDQEISTQELRRLLALKLAKVSIPSRFFRMKELPKTESGKVDRKALNVEDSISTNLQRSSPLQWEDSETSQLLKQIWYSIFNSHDLDFRYDFIELGGDSFKMIQLKSKIVQTFHVDISLEDIYANADLGQLSKLIDHLMVNKRAIIIPKVEPADFYPVYHRQVIAYKRFSDFKFPDNIQAVFRIEHYDKKILKKTFDILVERHESLRTVLFKKDDLVYQAIRPSVEYELNEKHITAEELSTKGLTYADEQKNRLFDLHTGPLFSLLVLDVENENALLVLTIDHVCSDEYSIKVLGESLYEIYHAILSNKEHVPQAADALQLKDYVSWLNKELSINRESYIKYWENMFRDLTTLSLIESSSHSKALGLSQEGRYLVNISAVGVIDHEMNRKELAGLYELVPQTNSSMNAVLLSACFIMLYLETGHYDHLIQLNNMNRSSAQLEKLVGWLTEGFFMRSGKKTERTVKTFIHELYLQFLKSSEMGRFQVGNLFGQTVDAACSLSFSFRSIEVGEITNTLLDRSHVVKPTANYYPMDIRISETKECLKLQVKYRNDLFSEEKIRSMIDAFERILYKMSTLSDYSLQDLNQDILVGEAEELKTRNGMFSK